MGTRAAIGRWNEDLKTWQGRYHHWDGYPSGLGATLYELANARTLGDLGATLRTLLNEHPAGWSTINGADWSMSPGYPTEAERFAPEGTPQRPACYCHGARSEDARIVTDKDVRQFGCEYAYVFDVPGQSMTVFAYPYKGRRRTLAVIDLSGPEPDWQAIENKPARKTVAA